MIKLIPFETDLETLLNSEEYINMTSFEKGVLKGDLRKLKSEELRIYNTNPENTIPLELVTERAQKIKELVQIIINDSHSENLTGWRGEFKPW